MPCRAIAWQHKQFLITETGNDCLKHFIAYRILDPHNSGYEEVYLLGNSAV
jgi:hypothetical protein